MEFHNPAKAYKILVPTDFNVSSDFALDAAKRIAHQLDGEIHFYHSADIPDDWEDLDVDLKVKDKSNKSIALQVRKKLRALQASCWSENISSHIHYTGGKFIDNIVEILEKVAFDLIVMGSHINRTKSEWYIDSNAQKVIRKFQIPTLVVKTKTKELNLSEVVYASEMNTRDQEAFRHFLEFIKPFNPKAVHLLAVNTKSFFGQPSLLMNEAMNTFKEIAVEFNCETHFYPDYSVESGIAYFSKEHDIGLVGISNLHSNKLKRLFQGSVVEFIANYIDAPVYVVDHEK